MANKGIIDEFVSEGAFKQLERAVSLGGQLESVYLKAIKAVIDASASVAKSTNLQDANKAINESTKAVEAVNEAQKKLNTANQEAVKIERQITEAVKGKLLGIQEENKLLNSLSGSLDDNIKLNLRLKLELKGVKEEQKELNKAAAGSLASKKDLADKTAELAKQELELKTAIQQSNLDIKRASKELSSAEGSYDALDAKLIRLRATYKALSEEEKNNINIGGALLASIQEYDTQLKSMDKSMGVHNRNVGNYTLATQNLKNSLLDLIPGARGVADTIESGANAFTSAKDIIFEYARGTETASVSTAGMTVVQKSAIISTEALAVSLKVLRIALIATGIGAIIVLLGSLIAYFASTQEGIDKVTSVTRPLVAVFQSLLGAAQKLGKAMVDAFSNPKQLLVDLVKYIETSVINRFKAFGVILEALAKRDFNKLQDGLFQAVTGVTNASQKVANFGKQAGKFFSEAANKGRQIDLITKEIEKAQLAFNRNQIKTNDLVDEQLLISKDTSRSFKEREKASFEIIRLRKNEGDEEARIIKMKMQKLALEQSLNDKGRAGTQEQIDLETQLDAAQDRGLDAQKEQMRVISGARKEAMREREELEKAAREKQIEAEKELLDLQMLQADTLADKAKTVADDEKLGLDDRLTNLQYYLDQKGKSIELEAQKELKAADLTTTGREIIELNKQNKLNALAKEGIDGYIKITEDKLSKEEKIRLDANKKALNDIDIQRDEMLIRLDKQYQDGEISLEDYNKRRLEIQKEYSQMAIEEEIRQTEAFIALQKSRGKDTSDEEAKIASLKAKYSKEAADAQIADLKKVEDAEKKLREMRRELSEELQELGITAVNSVFDNRLEKLEKEDEAATEKAEMDRRRIEESLMSEDEKAIALAQIDDRERARKEQMEARQRQIELQRARFEKAISIARIIAATAEAVIKAVAASPLTSGLPFSAIAAGIGAVQIAQVLATKIPAFEEGGTMKNTGLALFGEVGTEGRIEPDGSFSLTPATPTIGHVKAGTQFISNKDLMQLIAKPEKINYAGANQISMDEVIKAVNNGAARTEKALSKLPPSTQITKSGWRKTQNRINGWTEYLGSRIN